MIITSVMSLCCFTLDKPLKSAASTHTSYMDPQPPTGKKQISVRGRHLKLIFTLITLIFM